MDSLELATNEGSRSSALATNELRQRRRGVARHVCLVGTAFGLLCTQLAVSGAADQGTRLIEESVMSTSLRSDLRPQTIPALRSWQPQSGTLVFVPNTSRIVVSAQDSAALLETVEVFARDFQDLTGFPIEVTNQSHA